MLQISTQDTHSITRQFNNAFFFFYYYCCFYVWYFFDNSKEKDFVQIIFIKSQNFGNSVETKCINFIQIKLLNSWKLLKSSLNLKWIQCSLLNSLIFTYSHFKNWFKNCTKKIAKQLWKSKIGFAAKTEKNEITMIKVNNSISNKN